LYIVKKCELATQEADIRRIWFKASLGKKFSRSHLNQWLGAVACACHPSYAEKPNRVTVQASPGIKQDPISKIFSTERIVGVI
jgi:hypothetical protein